MTESKAAPTIHWAALTCVGLRRDHNEDAVVVGKRVLSHDMTAPVTGTHSSGSPLLLAVADGMGGHAAGERASRLVADGIARSSASLTNGQEIQHELRDLNDEIYATMRQRSETLGMGTTIAGAIISANELTVFHAGDSRVYVGREDGFERVTDDHVVAPQTGILTNCLGGEDRPTPVDVTLRTLDLGDVNAVLVCSDGLSDLVDLDGLTLPVGADPAAAVAMLVHRTFELGAHDNTSVVLAAIR